MSFPDSKVYGANMGPTWGRQDPGGPHEDCYLGRHFADDIFKVIFLNENVWIPIKFSLKFVPKGPIHNIPALVQIMAWWRPGDKPLSEPMVVSSLTHICVTRPQWAKVLVFGCIITDVCVNWLRHGDAHIHQWTGSSLDQVMDCRLYSAVSSPEPTRMYCKLDLHEQTSKWENFYSENAPEKIAASNIFIPIIFLCVSLPGLVVSPWHRRHDRYQQFGVVDPTTIFSSKVLYSHMRSRCQPKWYSHCTGSLLPKVPITFMCLLVQVESEKTGFVIPPHIIRSYSYGELCKILIAGTFHINVYHTGRWCKIVSEDINTRIV